MKAIWGKKEEEAKAEPVASGSANPGSNLVKDRAKWLAEQANKKEEIESAATGTVNPGSDLASDRKKWLESAFKKKQEEEDNHTGTDNPGHDLVRERTNKIWGPKEEKEEEALPFGAGDIVLVDDKKAYFIKGDSDGRIIVQYLDSKAQESVELSRCRAG